VAVNLTKRALAEITVEASLTEVSETLKGIMPFFDILFKGETFTEPNGIELLGKCGVTWRSWGETIKIKIKEEGGNSIVHAESESSLGTTLIDYGKNKENLQRLFLELTRKYKSTSPLALKEKVL
jgi:hypothetical protein